MKYFVTLKRKNINRGAIYKFTTNVKRYRSSQSQFPLVHRKVGTKIVKRSSSEENKHKERSREVVPLGNPMKIEKSFRSPARNRNSNGFAEGKYQLPFKEIFERRAWNSTRSDRNSGSFGVREQKCVDFRDRSPRPTETFELLSHSGRRTYRELKKK